MPPASVQEYLLAEYGAMLATCWPSMAQCLPPAECKTLSLSAIAMPHPTCSAAKVTRVGSCRISFMSRATGRPTLRMSSLSGCPSRVGARDHARRIKCDEVEEFARMGRREGNDVTEDACVQRHRPGSAPRRSARTGLCLVGPW